VTVDGLSLDHSTALCAPLLHPLGGDKLIDNQA
jgi:hypothetical protein